MFERGYLRVFSWKGVPVRLHWTLPLGALLFSGGAIAPFVWLGFFLLVLLHEVGHAIVVRRFGHRVTAIDITGFGGMCRWTGAASGVERSLIAFGGVAAQLLLLALTLVLIVLFPKLDRGWSAQLVSVFLSTNLWLAALNLLPFPPLDGHQAWRIAAEVRRPGGASELARALFFRPLSTSSRGFRQPAAPKAARASWWSRFRWPWRTKSAAVSSRGSETPQPMRPGPEAKQGAMNTQQLADLFRNVGDQAGKVRGTDKRRWN
jgi:Zn-dependent protease